MPPSSTRAALLLSLPLLGLPLGTACMPLPHTWDPVEEFPTRTASVHTPAPRDPDQLRILTWNLKFAGARTDFFFDGWGDRVHMTEREALFHMDGILRLIDETEPDILLAQEVDIGSTRSAYIDMVDIILENSHFNHAAWVPVWDVDYVPEEGLGRVEMGQAVFSRWPIERNTRIDLPQSTESSKLVNTFWLHRAVQLTEVDTGDRVISVVNNHPEAYSLDGTKQKHLATIYEWSKEMFLPIVVGGDFNVIPPGSLKTEGFADNAPADTIGVTEVYYTQEEMDALLPFYDTWNAAIPLEDYQVDTLEEQERFFSHSVSGKVFWTQKLDYLFSDGQWSGAWTLQSPGDGDRPLLSDPMDLSDHAPILGVLELP
jgi:endonuclease/exonuclease/phosphatase family metal-dependent hydrolase